MANKLPDKEMVSLEEVVLSQSYEMAAIITLLEKKGLLTREEILEEIMNMRSKADA